MDDINLTVNFSDEAEAEAVLVHWIYDQGAKVRMGDVVAEAMVDKVTLAIEAPADGYLIPVVAANDVFHSGQAVARISVNPPAPANSDGPNIEASPEQSAASPAFVPAPPAVRRYAQEKGVVLADVARGASGRRLTVADVDAWIRRQTLGETVPYPAFRRSLIQHLTDPAALPTTLHRRIASGPAAVAPLARIAWAVSEALPHYPRIHGWASSEGTVAAHKLVLGIASETPSGLMVPVLHAQPDINSWVLAFADLRNALKTQATGTLDFSRPSFVLSNLGPWGIEYFTPRLVTPTIAILGIGAGDTAFPVSLTFDHRAVDGAEAAEFLAHVDRVLASSS